MAKKTKSVIKEMQEELNSTVSGAEDLRIIQWKERQRGLKVLEYAKKLEEKKKKYVWITKEKTSKLVHPKNVKKYLQDGWKITNINNQIKK